MIVFTLIKATVKALKLNDDHISVNSHDFMIFNQFICTALRALEMFSISIFHDISSHILSLEHVVLHVAHGAYQKRELQ